MLLPQYSKQADGEHIVWFNAFPDHTPHKITSESTELNVFDACSISGFEERSKFLRFSSPSNVVLSIDEIELLCMSLIEENKI